VPNGYAIWSNVLGHLAVRRAGADRSPDVAAAPGSAGSSLSGRHRPTRKPVGQLGRSPTPKGTPMLNFLVTLQVFVMDRVEQSKDRGATMIEYGMICALIIAVVVAAMGLLNTSIGTLFTKVSTNITNAKVG
jgi:pilus assembly protein Flp/PilA